MVRVASSFDLHFSYGKTPTVTQSDKSDTTLGARVAVGAMWLVVSRLILRSLGLISTIVLARLLVPDDFGLVAIAIAVHAMLTGITQMSLAAALIRFKTTDRADYDTAWTLSTLRGLLLALAILACSFFLPQVIDDMRLSAILLVMVALPIINGLKNPRMVEFEKELDFSRDSLMLISAKIVSVMVSITIAVIWRNYWAIVAGLLTAASVRLIVGYVLRPYRPAICFASTRRILSFTIWLTGNHVINAISFNIDKLIVGSYLNVRTTGLYYMGQEISSLLTRELFEPVSRALYPGFVKTSNQSKDFRQDVRSAIAIFAAVGLPVGVGFAIVAPEFVRLVLGDKWIAIIPMIQVLAPVLGIQTLTSVAQGVLLSLGETKAMFWRALVAFALRLPLLIAGVYLAGFVGIYVAHAASGLILFTLNYVLLVRIVGLGITDPIMGSMRSIVSLVFMLSVLLIAQNFIGHSGDALGDLALVLAAKVGLGVFSYCSCHYLLWRLASRPNGPEKRIFDLLREAIQAGPSILLASSRNHKD